MYIDDNVRQLILGVHDNIDKAFMLLLNFYVTSLTVTYIILYIGIPENFLVCCGTDRHCILCHPYRIR